MKKDIKIDFSTIIFSDECRATLGELGGPGQELGSSWKTKGVS